MPQQLIVKAFATGDPGLQLKPSRLPEFAWLLVKELQIDRTYQHKPYDRAIEELLADFKPELSGPIFVNVRVDARKFIIDGATRWQVRERRGDRWILAEIVRGLTLQQEAEAYIVKAQNKQRQPIDWFVAEVAAGRPEAKLINDILNAREILVDSFAASKGVVKGQLIVSCVRDLKRALAMDPSGDLLQTTLDLVLATWGYKKRAFTGDFLLCLAGLLAKHSETIVRSRFINKFSKFEDIGDLWDEARKTRQAATPRITLRRALHIKLVEMYNLGAKRRLQD
jgi:hypothetical protein